jgi:histidyl-tRNA synthetase
VKYGKQIRYAERRGIPFVWFPQDADRHEVRDIRTGDQHGADPVTWAPPDVDRRPFVTHAPHADTEGS